MKSSILRSLIFVTLFLSVSNASYSTPSDVYIWAIENSYKSNSSKYNYESKEEDLNQVYAKLYPQLEGSVGYSVNKYERNEMAGRVNSPNVEEHSKEVALTLSQVIYNPALMSTIDTEKSRVKYYSYDYEKRKQDIAKEVLDVYMSVLNIKNKIDLLDANLNYISQNKKVIDEKFKMALVTKMDFLKIEVEAQKSKIDLIKEQKNYDVMLQKLLDLVKKDDILIPDFNLSKLSDSFIANLLKFLEENSTLDKNVDILQARSALEMTTNDLRSAKDEFLPDLSMSASYTKYISKDETTDYNNYARAMMTLRIPLFSGGETYSKVKSKKLLMKSATEELKSIEDDTNLRFNETNNLLRSEIDTLKMYKDALVSGELYLKSVQLAYDKGLKSIVDLFDAKNKLFEIKYDYIKSVHEMSNLFVEFLIITNNLDRLDLIDILVEKEGVK